MIPKALRKPFQKTAGVITGDLGTFDEGGLHFSARTKMVIKPKGYQVYPVDVENFISKKFADKVSVVGVVGVPHDIFTEGVMAFIELKEGASLTANDVMHACHEISSYSRPSHARNTCSGYAAA